MGPLPKRKISKGRKNRRRAHDAIGSPGLVACPNCRAKMMPHRVCPTCGQYRGRQVIALQNKK
jgi:large subunit ribosomal protein L32